MRGKVPKSLMSKKIHVSPYCTFVHLDPNLNVHLDLFWRFFVHLGSSEICSFGLDEYQISDLS